MQTALLICHLGICGTDAGYCEMINRNAASPYQKGSNTMEKKKYSTPNVYDLGCMAELTAGSQSGGTETSTKTCGGNNLIIYWRNNSPGHRAHV